MGYYIDCHLLKDWELNPKTWRLCIKVGRGQEDGDMGRVCGDLGTRDEGLGDIKYGTRGRVGRGRGDDNDY